MMRLAFVVPRYGPDILGGAESLARGFAERLVQKGQEVEVWTTCAQEYTTWQNVYPAGVEKINEVVVRRFPAVVYPRVKSDEPVEFVEAEYSWVDQGMHSPTLYHYLFQHGQSFDYLIVIPYPFGFSCYSANIYPERSIIWPCLHNEPPAYFEPVRVMLHQARGVILNSHAEERFLYQRLGIKNPRQQVVGFGLEVPTGRAERFYRRYTHVKAPFVLYAGRLEREKNVNLLLDYFIEYCKTRNNDVNLVLIGKGSTPIPDHPRIFHLGYLSEQEKQDAYAAATVLCQPSVNESFGIVLMEAWLQETPVLVHGKCQVTLEHCRAAQGGLWFQDNFEFREVMDFLLAHPDLAQQMGRNGRGYVDTHYGWDKVLQKLEDTLEAWRAA